MNTRQVLIHAGAIVLAAAMLWLTACSSPAVKAEKEAAKVQLQKVDDTKKLKAETHPLLHMDTTVQKDLQPVKDALVWVNVVSFILFLCSVGLLLTPLAADDKIALPVTGVATIGSLFGIIFLRLAWPISIAVGVIVVAAVVRYIWKYRVTLGLVSALPTLPPTIKGT